MAAAGEIGIERRIVLVDRVPIAARGVRLVGPDGLYEDEVLKAGTCDAALGTEMRITFASLPFEKMKGDM